VPALAGRRVTLIGMPCATRRVETRSGGLTLFLTIADRSGIAECVLFPDAYRTAAERAHGAIVRVDGRVDETLGAVTLVVDRVTALRAADVETRDGHGAASTRRGAATIDA
jgi:DNA polymerase III alpha subunit